ncbi:PREDICTED: catalase-like [Papilio xuthus]|uniref:Catalase-like n=1 Tax=Papilio xuthus TaxID=66420 RepID=A0AAJ6ZIE1_PAPXU|nr:PREDICTED: catalase-like [Papilio xuthus]
MDGLVVRLILVYFVYQYVSCSEIEFISYQYENRTDPATRQLYEFRKYHPKPIGLMTTSFGRPVEIRDTNALNTDLFSNSYLTDSSIHTNDERIPERIVHAKGTAALGYFEVTNDVSKYTKADVFNGIGKKTPIIGRFSTAVQYKGGNDLARETKALAVKFYTKEGNLDFLCLNQPIYFYKDPILFSHLGHALKKNPKTFLFDHTAEIDLISLRPELLPAYLWSFSDYGIPNGYRKMDVFPIHTYEIHNKHGERYFVKFNLRSEQGLEVLTTEEAIAVGARDPDYFSRDIYNSIEEKKFPSWKLEMDVISFKDLPKVPYNIFQVNRFWRKGTYKTVQIGRLVFNRNPDNMFHTAEQSAFNPANLVPGIPGPVDYIFKTRRFVYPDAQKYRLGVNHNKIEVNCPLYQKDYNRDGVPPLKDNMRDVPNYYPDSFSGPISYVDAARPGEKIVVYESNAIDLAEAAYVYNEILRNDTQRDRLAANAARLALPAPPLLQRRFIELLYLTDKDLGDRVYMALKRALQAQPPPSPVGLTIEREVCSNSVNENTVKDDYYERK